LPTAWQIKEEADDDDDEEEATPKMKERVRLVIVEPPSPQMTTRGVG
jgi:hypothetical protein